MAADLVTILETVAVTQLLTPTGKALGETMLERGKQVAGKAVAYLTTVGRQPQTAAEKLLVPIALGAGLESDPTFVDYWAALLANAVDPAQRVQVQPSFAEVLRQLTSDDAQIMEFIYNEWNIPDDNEPFGEDSTLTIAAVFSRFEWSGDRIELSLDNLLRLRLHEEFRPMTYGGVPERELSNVVLTAYGAHFIRAVTPPVL